MSEDKKIALPKYLSIITSGGLPMPKAMKLAGTIYKIFNTPAHLSALTDAKLITAGIPLKEDRKQILSAIRKAGYTAKTVKPEYAISESSNPPTTVETIITPTKRKRKAREDDLNEFLPQGPPDEASKYGSLEFNEVLDENVLKTKIVVVNRAPVMTAWAFVVAEHQGFQREEALSIASAYTEMNAISKGASIGVYDKGKAKDLDAQKDGVQPYVDLMGRSPLYQTQTKQWRALSNNSPVKPSDAFSYISRSLRQTTPFLIGALRLLAASYSPSELNKQGYGIYADFRPSSNEWGSRSEVKCSTILSLRKPQPPTNNASLFQSKIVYESKPDIDESEPPLKKERLAGGNP